MITSQAAFTRQNPTDLRQVMTGAELLCYWDLRPYVSGAQASLTLSATLASDGPGTPPIVTMTGPLNPPRQVIVTYPTGGTLPGTLDYRIDCGDGWNAASGFHGTTTTGDIDIGGGNHVILLAGTYNAAHRHWAKAASWAELTGRANCTLTDVLSAGAGHRYEAHGMGGVHPSLYMWNSYLANSLAVPALVSGLDVPFEMWMLCETWTLTDGAKSFAVWGFTHSLVANNAKNILDCFSGGPTAGTPNQWCLQRIDSGGTLARFASTYKPHLSPMVMRATIGANSQVWDSGQRTRPAGDQSTNRGVSTSLDRFVLGAVVPGTAAATNTLAQTRVSTLALTAPLAAGRDLVIGKALAGRIP